MIFKSLRCGKIRENVKNRKISSSKKIFQLYPSVGPIHLALFYKCAIIPYDVILSFGIDLSSPFFLRCAKLGAQLFSVPSLVSHPLMHHSSLSAPFLVCYSPFFNGHSKAHHSLCVSFCCIVLQCTTMITHIVQRKKFLTLHMYGFILTI